MTGAFGPNHVYRVETRPAAGFRLALDNDRFHAGAGQTFEIKVNCARGEFKGPITLDVQDANGRLNVTNNVIEEGKTNATLKVVAPDEPAKLHFLSVIGSARRDGITIETRASTGAVWRRRFPQMFYAPAEFDGVVALGIVETK